MQGWIKLHRKITESAIFYDADMLRLWIYCLSKASHKGTKVLVEKTEIELLPGQFVTGRFSLHDEYNSGVKHLKKVKETTLWSWLKRLETYGNLDIKSYNKYSVVTVVKWSEYQDTLTTEQQQTDNRLTTNCQQTDTNKNVKNVENENTKDSVDATASKRFIKPSIQQVIEYCQERNNGVDANKWYDFYESKGWKVGSNSMKDWKAAVRTWEKSSTPSISESRTSIPKQPKEFVPEGDLLEWVKAANAHVRN